MKYYVFFLILIGLSGLIIPQSFADNLFYGEATFERVPESIIPGIQSEFEIKFLYTGAPYTLQNLTAIIETNPKTASQYVHYVLDSTEMTPSTVGRIHVTITIDKSIPNEKIFLSVTYVGTDLHGNSFRSAWADTLTLDVTSKNFTSSKLPSSQDYPFEKLTGATCDGRATVCYGTFLNGTTISIQCDYLIHGCDAIPFDYAVSPLSPLKQIKNGVALIDIQCSEGKYAVYKYNRMRVACVSEETQNELWSRGWATMRLSMPGDDISHALCNNYEGKWHQEYNGCRDISDLQCSLIGGKFVDDLKICENGICPDRGYEICVTENEN